MQDGDDASAVRVSGSLPSSFRDKIAAFNKGSDLPLAPKDVPKRQSFVRKPFIPPPPSKDAFILPPKAPKPPPPARDVSLEANQSIVNKSSVDEMFPGSSEISKETLKERILAIQKGLDYSSKSDSLTQKQTEPLVEERESPYINDGNEIQPPASPASDKFLSSSPEVYTPQPPPLSFVDNETRSTIASQGHDEELETELQQEFSVQGESPEIDSETARRQALRERMAKMSGGMGMHMAFGRSPGMTGMTNRPQTKQSSPPSSPSSQVQNPIPILPGLPPLRQTEREHGQQRSQDTKNNKQNDEDLPGARLQRSEGLPESFGSNEISIEVSSVTQKESTALSDDEGASDTPEIASPRSEQEEPADENDDILATTKPASSTEVVTESPQSSEYEEDSEGDDFNQPIASGYGDDLASRTMPEMSTASSPTSASWAPTNTRSGRPQLPPPPLPPLLPHPPHRTKTLQGTANIVPPIPSARPFDSNEDHQEIRPFASETVSSDKALKTQLVHDQYPSSQSPQTPSSSSPRAPPPPPPFQPPTSPPRRALQQPPPIPSVAPVYGRTQSNWSTNLPPVPLSAPFEIGHSSDIYGPSSVSQGQIISSSSPSVALRRTVSDRQSLEIPEPRTSVDRTLGDPLYMAMRDENFQEGSNWWLEPNSPPPIYDKRDDLVVEVEDSRAARRGGRSTMTREVYVLFTDYSQKMITVQYDLDDSLHPTFSQRNKPPPPDPSKTELENWHRQLGPQILSSAESRLGENIGDGTSYAFVKDIVGGISSYLPSPDAHSHGFVVYSNIGNSSTKQCDEIRPGDIVVFRNVIFQTHGGLRGKSRVEVGKPEHVAVVQEWNGSKKKLKVFEQRPEQRRVSHNSYKISELKTGEVHVFRPIPRSWIDW
jgi:myosin tail region-interacting protein MTI1